jgi:hypothetical protein
MSGGKGVYFDTKEDAIDAVRKLQRAGRTNIDVGCMQINLRYHPEAFENLDEAFDPETNVAYAAYFLKALRKDAANWREAAGHYHSIDPERALLYREKLARLSGLARDVAIVDAPDQSDQRGQAPTRAQRQVDHLRTAALNAAFRTRADKTSPEDFAEKRATQLEQWREARSNSALYKKLIAAQGFARKQAVQKRTPEDRDDFAAKRRAQLAAWRQSREMDAARR